MRRTANRILFGLAGLVVLLVWVGFYSFDAWFDSHTPQERVEMLSVFLHALKPFFMGLFILTVWCALYYHLKGLLSTRLQDWLSRREARRRWSKEKKPRHGKGSAC